MLFDLDSGEVPWIKYEVDWAEKEAMLSGAIDKAEVYLGDYFLAPDLNWYGAYYTQDSANDFWTHYVRGQRLTKVAKADDAYHAAKDRQHFELLFLQRRAAVKEKTQHKKQLSQTDNGVTWRCPEVERGDHLPRAWIN